ncbi:ABC transporter G family member 20-like [Oppia nitens]|uniref:ABC transporter G family member 20-like n=1 Tax=Oppia nitens TaxID=1686743 RepID=UPI0023D9E132|nr:ABC transporter G family member 20-like [Oppia nitens]
MSAIHVQNVTFRYNKKHQVLDNLQLSVDTGQIYALLGPSGGGKTTLLRLILGRINLQHGQIRIHGHQSPGARANSRISYMPQNQALCLQFNVGQTMRYFQHIYRQSRTEFEDRYKTLKSMLELPDDDRCLVGDLSGGQQRRLSLAAALLNNARLLILDEPTVGIDLLLIHNIWHYLNRRCLQGGSTIMFVTHYIQEANNAHTVGLMRNGRLLAERNPQQLVTQYSCSSLEMKIRKQSLK